MPIMGAFIAPHPPVIIPLVGGGREKEIQMTIDAYEEIGRRIASLKPDTIVVISPHSVMYADYIHISPGESAQGDFGAFRAGGVAFHKEYDHRFVEELAGCAQRRHIPAGTQGQRDKKLDHGVLVPAYFIEKCWSDYRLVRVSLSGLSSLTHYRFGQCIGDTAEKLGRRAVLVASGDLSHKLTRDGPYGYAKEGPAFDRLAVRAMSEADFMTFLRFPQDFVDAAAECGLRSFIEMAGALDGKAVKPELLSYEGPFGVGYAVCAYSVTGTDKDRCFGDLYEREQLDRLASQRGKEDEYVSLAREALETYVQTGKRMERPERLSAELTKRKAGVFISLKKDGRLRGCIGTTAPTTCCLAEEIMQNAVSAGTKDPRFDPVAKSELESLVYSVDVLSEPEPVESAGQLDVKRYGVIVSHGFRRGLLLPDLEGVDTPQEQIRIAMQKAGISEEEKISLQRFEVVRHH